MLLIFSNASEYLVGEHFITTCIICPPGKHSLYDRMTRSCTGVHSFYETQNLFEGLDANICYNVLISLTKRESIISTRSNRIPEQATRVCRGLTLLIELTVKPLQEQNALLNRSGFKQERRIWYLTFIQSTILGFYPYNTQKKACWSIWMSWPSSSHQSTASNRAWHPYQKYLRL